MNAIATITALTTAPRLDAEGRGEHHFTVTNVTDRRIRFGFKVIAESGPPGGVFGEGGDLRERELGPNETATIVVHIKVPKGTPPGHYPLHLRAYDTSRPGDLYTDGPTERFEVVGGGQENGRKRKVPWRMVAAVAAVLVVVAGGIVAYVVIGGDSEVAVPDVVGQSTEQARAALGETGLSATSEDAESNRPRGTVISTAPPPGRQVEPGSAVTLQVSTGTKVFEDPMYKGHRLDWCLTWAQHCGNLAATAWCRIQGFEGASSHAIDENIGGPRSPTIVMGGDRLCTDPVCDGFSSVTCSNQVNGLQVFSPTIREALSPNIMEMIREPAIE